GVDPWELAVQGAQQEGFASASSGFVGGGMYGGLLRAGALPPNTWNALATRGVRPSGLLVRGLASPYGLGAGAIGYSSSIAGTVARQWIHGEEVDPFSGEAQRDALIGAALSQSFTLLDPYTRGYWRTRYDQRYSGEMKSLTNPREWPREFGPYP